ncbi:hypothetical protein EV383_5703 [Pseudonocardia sediminis]|uniref:Restriction endonuclease n=1 Tax=Pseudonocardia sediminis TaxID=1397368 RepID=A0A4Q7V4Y2_PSEST|nr:nuclease-related domain-containing protein [Pseudonocardia sediminis]RZT88758.1 hypothetical protein EV383_5703 [Pseudonocardia sediminis]
MLEPNEEIVRRFFERKGYFVRSRLRYRVPNGYSDIDLLLLRPDGTVGAVEVKGWHAESITASTLTEWPVWNFTSAAADEAIYSTVGRRVDIERFLVVGQIGKNSKDAVLSEARTRGVQVIEFPEILGLLVREVSLNENADSDAEHMIRLLLRYGLLSKDS